MVEAATDIPTQEPIEETEEFVKKRQPKCPLPSELPSQEAREFNNTIVEKPPRKLTSLKVRFGDLTDKNFEQMRIINYLTLPVVYSEDFYNKLIT